MRVGIVNTNSNIYSYNQSKSNLTFTSSRSEAKAELGKVLKAVAKGNICTKSAMRPISKLLFKINKNTKDPQKTALNLAISARKRKKMQINFSLKK